MNCTPSFSGKDTSPSQFLPFSGFGSPRPILPTGSGFPGLHIFSHVIPVTDPNPPKSLRFSHGVLKECFGHGTLLMGLQVSIQGGRSRLLAGSDNVFRVFGRAVAAGGVDHVR